MGFSRYWLPTSTIARAAMSPEAPGCAGTTASEFHFSRWVSSVHRCSSSVGIGSEGLGTTSLWTGSSGALGTGVGVPRTTDQGRGRPAPGLAALPSPPRGGPLPPELSFGSYIDGSSLLIFQLLPSGASRAGSCESTDILRRS